MPVDGYILSESDVEFLRKLKGIVSSGLIDRLERMSRRTPPAHEEPSPPVHVARVSPLGIPALEDEPGTGSGTGSDLLLYDRPGTRYCDIWRVVQANGRAELRPLGARVLVHNLSTQSVEAGQWIPVVRAASGHWLAVCPNCVPGADQPGEDTQTTYDEAEWTTDQTSYDVPDGYSGVTLTVDQPIDWYGVDMDDGRVVTFTNVGTDYITVYESSPLAGTSQMQFSLPGSPDPGHALALGPGDSMTVWKQPGNGNVVLSTTAPYLPEPYDPGAVSPLSGSYNNYPVPAGVTSLSPTLSGATTFTGLDGLAKGSEFTLYNPSSNSNDITLSHLSGSSSAGNQFDLSGGANLTVSPGEGVRLFYDGLVISDVGASTSLSGGSVGSQYPGWVKVTKTYSDFAAAATTNDIEVYSLPAKGVLHGVVLKHTAAFTGGGILAYGVTAGVTGNLTKYGTSNNVFNAPSDTTFMTARNNEDDLPDLLNFGAATSIRVRASSTGANLDQATSGSLDIYLLVSTLP